MFKLCCYVLFSCLLISRNQTYMLTCLSHMALVSMHNSLFGNERRCRYKPRYRPIRHSNRSIQTLARSEETDKGSEAGIGHLIDCRNIPVRLQLCPCEIKPTTFQISCKLQMKLLCLSCIFFNVILPYKSKRP